MARKPTKIELILREGIAERARLGSIDVTFVAPRPKLRIPTPNDERIKRPQRDVEEVSAEDQAVIDAARTALPPFDTDNDPVPAEPSKQEVAAALKSYKAAQARLRAAQRDMEKLKPAVRSEALAYWIGRYVLRAECRADWTISSILHQNFLARAKEYGSNRIDAAILKDAVDAINPTRFGTMLREAGVPKERRSRPDGNYYPLKLRKDA